MAMFKLDDYEVFKENLSTLKICSRDRHSEADEEYMTMSELDAVDFDLVKEQYVQPLHLTYVPSSNDCIFINADGDPVFVEFKNGWIGGGMKIGLTRKIYDSLLIFQDITGKGLSYTRENMDYVLVYNENKNSEEPKKPKQNVQESESRDNISKMLSEKGGGHFIKFGLEKFQRYCFRNVYTYTEKEFERKYLTKNN